MIIITKYFIGDILGNILKYKLHKLIANIHCSHDNIVKFKISVSHLRSEV